MKNPKAKAFSLMQRMIDFKGSSEETSLNSSEESQRREIVRQMDWEAFDKVLTELKFLQKNW